MSVSEKLSINLHQAKKYLDRCFDWIYLEFLRKSKNKIENFLILSIYPLIILFCGFFMIIEISQFRIGGNFTFFSYLIVYFGGAYQCLWKYFIFLWYDEKWKRIRDFIEDIKTSIQTNSLLSDIRIREYQETLKFYVLFVRGCSILLVFSVSELYIYNAYVTNFTSGLMYTIPLLPETSAFYRPVNLIFQLICLVLMTVVFIGSDFILAIVVGCLDGELRSIIAYILTIENEATARNEGKEILKTVYKNHLRVLSVLNDLRSIFWHLSLQMLLTTFLYICFTFFLARVVSISITTFILCFNSASLLLIYSHLGQILLNRTELLAYALWQTSWYNLAIDDQKAFLMVLRIAQKPIGLNAGGFFIISNNTFVKIMKAAITFGALLYAFIS
uniref:Odorant receptor n=1 Tax=Phlebotomus papatasi TaxID=29031 RepID=A0A3F2ZEB3_PHLPP